MSLYINRIIPNTITFNGEEVNTVYYKNKKTMSNPVLIWTKWPGWDNALWKDIYNLCKMKQAGVISEWPEDVKLGNTIYVSYRSFYNDNNPSGGASTSYTLPFQLIGIDIDGPGILTFMCKYTMPIRYVLSNTNYHQVLTYAPIIFENEGLDENEFKHYIQFESVSDTGNSIVHYLKDYIKPLRKETYNVTDGKIEVFERYFWDLSCAEAGIECEYPPCFTEGVSTPYFNGNLPTVKLYVLDEMTSGGHGLPVSYGSREFTYMQDGFYWEGDTQIPYYEYDSAHTFGTNDSKLPSIRVSTFPCPCFAIG